MKINSKTVKFVRTNAAVVSKMNQIVSIAPQRVTETQKMVVNVGQAISK